jgi:hypothetical protein
LPFDANTHNCEYSYRKFASWDYTLLYNILSTYCCSCMYSITSVDYAVTSLNAVVLNAMDSPWFHQKVKIPSLVLECSMVLYMKQKKKITMTEVLKRKIPTTVFERV